MDIPLVLDLAGQQPLLLVVSTFQEHILVDMVLIVVVAARNLGNPAPRLPKTLHYLKNRVIDPPGHLTHNVEHIKNLAEVCILDGVLLNLRILESHYYSRLLVVASYLIIRPGSRREDHR